MHFWFRASYLERVYGARVRQSGIPVDGKQTLLASLDRVLGGGPQASTARATDFYLAKHLTAAIQPEAIAGQTVRMIAPTHISFVAALFANLPYAKRL